MARRTKVAMQDPALPAQYRSPDGWPPPMRAQWGDDEGETHSEQHREAHIAQFRKARRVLDEFAPDIVVLFGDDQYENFRDDIIPPVCVLAHEGFEFKPWRRYKENVWGEPEDKVFTVKGHREAGKTITRGLLEAGFEVSYAYKPLHDPLAHAFMMSLLFLDWDRRGWPYPLVPFAINCYGSKVVLQRGSGATGFSQATMPNGESDPPSPPPWRCFDLGAALVRSLKEKPWRVALVASSSWSHASLTAKNYFLFPDVEADKRYYEALRAGDYQVWRNTTTAEIEERGHQELLNWFCLAGAMAELGRKPKECVFLESWLCNSDRVFAIYPPE